MDAFVLSLGVTFLAELGDKRRQLMALAFATRFPAVPVLIAISLATLLVDLGSGRGCRSGRSGSAQLSRLSCSG